ncbi:kinase-like domain-containing protein [Mycena olivaceomarginata]|nr:kinase-like domain-containing protein [Mycena olivaceomarginata]
MLIISFSCPQQSNFGSLGFLANSNLAHICTFEPLKRAVGGLLHCHSLPPFLPGGPMSEYVATRWYRAPEIMLSFAMYSKAIDMWAIGCILAELLSKRPFFPGRDYFSQLNLVLNVLGTPNQADILDITSERSRNYIRALPWRKNKDFRTLFPQASLEATDFLLKALMFNPMKRFTVEEALQHPYLAGYHDPDDEPVIAPPDPSYFDFDMHKEPLTTNQLKALLYEEVVSVVPSI